MLPYGLIKPLLFAMDAERAHRLTLTGVRLGLAGGRPLPANPVRLGDLALPNPVGLAAGFDKDGEAIDGLLRLGFGFVEIGGVTPLPQPGNDRPRVFRLAEDVAVINRYGLNSKGAEAVARNLSARRRQGVVGVNLGANKESGDRIGDYAECLKALGGMADFATVNVSSPNTPGLRALQGKAALTGIFDRLHQVQSQAGLSTPLLLKLAPDLAPEDVDDVVEVIDDLGITALVISNTTVARPDSLRSRHASETGGLSGAPLMPLATEMLGIFRDRLEGRVPLVGVGGIMSGADAVAKMKAGASAVQFYTGLIYRGPALIRECAEAIAARRP